MNKKNERRLLVENLEQRVVLDGVGLDAAVTPPDWESVIVAFNDNVDNPGAAAREVTAAHGGRVGHTYEHAIKGFSAQFPKAALDALSENRGVKRIEPNLEMHAFEQTLPTGVDRIEADSNTVANIDGIDGIDGSDERVDVGVAVIDTGIDKDHPDLNVAGGRRFYTISTGPPSQRGSADDDNYDDDNGHGSHVAGTVGALDNGFGVVGVAPGARLYGVKVLDASGSGYLSDIIAGIDWVTETRADNDPDNDIDVANMSLGGQGVSDSYRSAIQNSVEAGVVYVVASGNDYRDILGDDLEFRTSDDTIPAAYPEVATISAIADTDGKPGGEGADTNFTDPYWNEGYADDTFADFSNYSNSDNDRNSWYDANNFVTSPGLGIDLMMPGVDIYSTYKDGGYATYSGTSMASPHAAGLAALYIAENGGATNADEVYKIRQALIDGGVPWRSENGLVSLEGEPLEEGESNDDSPDKHEENLGWAADQADTTAPAQPSGLTATAGDTLASLDWDDNTESDLAGYNVYRSTTSGNYSDTPITSVTESAYTDTGLQNGTTYYYVVTAVDTSDNESEYSGEASATPDSDDTAPSAPTDFTVTVPTSDGGILNLDWADNTESDLAGYNVYRSTTKDDYSDPVITSVIDSEYTDTGLDNGTTYYYVVTAVDTSDNESDYSSEESGTPIDNLAPDAPGSLAATAGDTEVSLDWADNTESDLAGYNVYRSTTKDDYSDPVITSVTDSEYTDSGLQNGTTYYYVVTAVDTSDNESDSSGEASATPTDLSTTMHVDDLDGSKNIKGRSGKWEAFVTVSIVDSGDDPVANATVSGEWSESDEIIASAEGDTASDGTVTFASGDLTGESVTFTVKNVTHGTLDYNSDSNVEESLTLYNATTASGSSLDSARGEAVTSLAVSAGDPSSRDPAGGNANRLGTDGPLASEPISQDQVIEASLAVGIGEQAEGQQGGDLYDVVAAEWAVPAPEGNDLELTPAKATDLALEEFETWGSALD